MMGDSVSFSPGQRWALAAILLLLVGFFPAVVYNNQIFLFLNGLHTSTTDVVWLSFTTMGDGLLLAIVLGCFLLVNPRVAIAGLLLMLASSAVIHLVKALYVLPRPPEVFPSVHVVGPLLRSGAFPSGHAASSVSAALAIAYFGSPRWLGVAALVVAALISASRIFVSAHFPTDVLGASIIALVLFMLFTTLVWPKIEDRIPSAPSLSAPFWRWTLLAEVLAALFALIVYSMRFAEYPPVAVAVSIAVVAFLATRYRKAVCNSLP
jgi:undecaprenyl-diphosphatase